MIITRRLIALLLVGSIFLSIGCTGLNTYGLAARSGTGVAGDTITLVMSWNQDIDRDDITVVITDSVGGETVYFPGDPAVRAMINSYPDPVSNLVVGGETNQFIVGAEPVWKFTIDGNITDGDPDWSQKILFLDLPAGMAENDATIEVSTGGAVSAGGTSIYTITVKVLPGDGEPHDFGAQEIAVNDSMLRALERTDHYTVSFSSVAIPEVVPHAIQLDLTHDPDVDNGGTGRAYVINTRGDIKSISWTKLSGSAIRIIIMPARGLTLAEFVDLKFYVAGGITGLAVDTPTVAGYDINGNDVTGLTATVN